MNNFDRGIWLAIETLAHSYEESAVRTLIKMSKFDIEKCLALSKESGFDSRKTMEVICLEMNWKNPITENK